MKIKPLFETTLAAPYQGKYLHAAGTKVALSHGTETKVFGELVWLAPNPVHLFLKSAQDAISMADGLVVAIKASPQQVFSELVNQDPTLTAERALAEDPSAKLVTSPPSDAVYPFVEASMKAQIFMAMAVEAFLNLMIPNDYKYSRMWKGKAEELSKEMIERKCCFEEKVEILSKIKNLPDLRQQPFWQICLEVILLRNDIIHWKTLGTPFKNYEDTYIRLFDVNRGRSLQAVVDLINYIEPGFVDLN